MCVALHIILVLFTAGCDQKRISFLADRDFSTGHWLLVKSNYVDETIDVIDDKYLLQSMLSEITVLSDYKDAETTCDGRLMLFKDGQLLAYQNFESNFSIFESLYIQSAYRHATFSAREVTDSIAFRKVHDSVMAIPNCYCVAQITPFDVSKNVIRYYQW